MSNTTFPTYFSTWTQVSPHSALTNETRGFGMSDVDVARGQFLLKSILGNVDNDLLTRVL